MATADSQEFSSVTIGSNRSFGLVFAGVFALIGLYPVVSGGTPRAWALIAAAAFLLPALIYPRCLQPLNRLWFALGMLLGRIINPLVMLLIYIVAMLPTGLVLKVMGRDPLRMKFMPESHTYWIERVPPGPPPDSMKNQF